MSACFEWMNSCISDFMQVTSQNMTNNPPQKKRWCSGVRITFMGLLYFSLGAFYLMR